MEEPLIVDDIPQDLSEESTKFEELKTPEKIMTEASRDSSPATPRDDVPTIAVGSIESYSSSASSTPRDESSSGSPSPIPDEFVGENGIQPKPKVKLGKDISLMMQALNSLQSPEEKIAALCKKYADLLEQQKIVQKQLRLSHRKQSQTQKEKEKLQTESNKAVLAKGKLENLARELQKRNKSLQEEQTRKSMEEVTLRQEMASNFQSTVNRIESQMRTAVEGSKQIQSENEKMGGKLNEIVSYHKNREEAMQKLLKQYEEHEKLLTAELEKTILVQEEQKEQDRTEKKQLLEQLLERNQLYENKLVQEKELRAQLEYYSDKFEEFQSTLEKSNKIFTSYRTEMDKMSKKLKAADKERLKIQKKWEDATKALAETVDYTQQLETKQARLEKLSRALQAERNSLIQKVREVEGDGKVKKRTNKKNKQDASMDRNDSNSQGQNTEGGGGLQVEEKSDQKDPAVEQPPDGESTKVETGIETNQPHQHPVEPNEKEEPDVDSKDHLGTHVEDSNKEEASISQEQVKGEPSTQDTPPEENVEG